MADDGALSPRAGSAQYIFGADKDPSAFKTAPAFVGVDGDMVGGVNLEGFF